MSRVVPQRPRDGHSGQARRGLYAALGAMAPAGARSYPSRPRYSTQDRAHRAAKVSHVRSGLAKPTSMSTSSAAVHVHRSSRTVSRSERFGAQQRNSEFGTCWLGPGEVTGRRRLPGCGLTPERGVGARGPDPATPPASDAPAAASGARPPRTPPNPSSCGRSRSWCFHRLERRRPAR